MSVSWTGINRGDLDPTFGNDINDLLAGSPYRWRIVFGYRTIAEQKALYEKHLQGGPLAAPPGQSAHNWRLACDVVPVNDDGSDAWSEKHPAWAWLRPLVDAHPRLHGGWAFGDPDHLQSTRWPQKRDELKASGEWSAYL